MMSTSQGTYVRIEQTSEAIRVTYEICRSGGGGGGGGGVATLFVVENIRY